MKDKNNKPDNQLKHDDNYILLNKSELNEIIKEAITQLKQLEDKPLTNYSNVMLLIIGIIYTFLYLYLTILLGFMVYEHYSFADIVTILCSDGVIILLGYAVFKKNNLTNSNIDKHFSLLTTIIAILLAISSL